MTAAAPPPPPPAGSSWSGGPAGESGGAGGSSGAYGRRLYRSRSNRMLAGVCGGIAEYFGSDPSMVRLLTVILDVLTGVFPLLIIYLIAAIFIPEGEPGQAGAPGVGVKTIEPGQLGLAFGVLLIGIGLLGFANRVLDIDWALLWPLVLVVLGAVVVMGSLRR